MKLRTILRVLMDFVYPGTCAQCEESCQSASPLCEKCLDQLVQLEAVPACPACAMSVAYPNAPCPYCQGHGPPLLDRVIRLGPFEDPLKTLIHQLKYHRLWPLGEYLADRLLEREPAKELLTESQVIVPIPLHPLRQISRGYNQAAVLAGRLARRCRIPVAGAIIRLRHTEMQTHMHAPSRREENLRDAFALVAEKKIRCKHVLLVDDVFTTGATLRAAARTIRAGGAVSVSAAVIGVVEPRQRQV